MKCCNIIVQYLSERYEGLHNRMIDEWLNNLLVTYIQSDIFNSIDNENIIEHLEYRILWRTIVICRNFYRF